LHDDREGELLQTHFSRGWRLRPQHIIMNATEAGLLNFQITRKAEALSIGKPLAAQAGWFAPFPGELAAELIARQPPQENCTSIQEIGTRQRRLCAWRPGFSAAALFLKRPHARPAMGQASLQYELIFLWNEIKNMIAASE
jgi:hypothetical protein